MFIVAGVLTIGPRCGSPLVIRRNLQPRDIGAPVPDVDKDYVRQAAFACGMAGSENHWSTATCNPAISGLEDKGLSAIIYCRFLPLKLLGLVVDLYILILSRAFTVKLSSRLPPIPYS